MFEFSSRSNILTFVEGSAQERAYGGPTRIAERDRTVNSDGSRRVGAALASLFVGTGLVGAKYVAYKLTGSTAVLSDVLESLVNVVAAGVTVASVLFAERPPDQSHPYGHGKIEFFSAAFEGGLVTFAALVVVYEAVLALVTGIEMRHLGVGVAIVAGGGVVNAALGWFLVRTGRRLNSLALVADGKHVLSDFWTSAGVVVGLSLVALTGLTWLDQVVALLVGANLARTGVKLVREASAALLDAEDSELMAKLLTAIEAGAAPGIIRVHHLRAIRLGRFTHVDAHLVVPEFWTIEHSHDVVDAFEKRVIDEFELEGEILFHSDPCRRAFCPVCDLSDCPIRVASFEGRTPLSMAEAQRPDPPITFSQ